MVLIMGGDGGGVVCEQRGSVGGFSWASGVRMGMEC